jgi:hypothetical protein
MPRTRRRINWVAQVAWAASVLMAGGLGYAMRVVVSPRGAAVLPVSAEQSAPPALAAESVSRRDAAPAPPSAPGPATSAPVESRLARTARKEVAPGRGLADASRDFADARGKVSAAAGAAAPATAAAAPPPEPLAQNQAKASLAPRALGSQQLRLEELVVSAATERSAPVTIPYPDAVARLGGRLRQIDGLIPRRLEAHGDTIRVVYRVGAREVVLVQRRNGDEIQVSLEAPPGFPTDSLDLLRTLVRD